MGQTDRNLSFHRSLTGARPPQSRSTPGEPRFALFVERGDAFAPVFGRDHAVVGLDFEHHAAGEVHLQPVVDCVLGLPHRDRGVIGDAARGFERFLDDFPGAQRRLTMPHS